MSEVAPGVEVEDVAFVEEPEYNFSKLEVGKSFRVESGFGKTARQRRNSLVQKARKWAEGEGVDAHFTSISEGEGFRIFMRAGKLSRHVPRKPKGF